MPIRLGHVAMCCGKIVEIMNCFAFLCWSPTTSWWPWIWWAIVALLWGYCGYLALKDDQELQKIKRQMREEEFQKIRGERASRAACSCECKCEP